MSRFGDDGRYRVESAKLLANLLHLHGGTPYIYQGEELGMTNAPFSHIDDFRDIESVNHYREAVGAGPPSWSWAIIPTPPSVGAPLRPWEARVHRLRGRLPANGGTG